MNKDILFAAKKLWDYHRLNHILEKSDCILALGNFDLRIAKRAADLYLEGMAPIVIMSGGLGWFTKHVWGEAEADKFAKIAVAQGVPQEDILVENKSTNTGENVVFTKRLVHEKGIKVKKLILVQKPFMERRSYATIRKQWPEVEVKVTSPQLSFEEYPDEKMTREMVINQMVGDLQRIMVYPAKGFSIAQDVPADVIESLEFLIKNGFDKRLVK